MQSQFKVPKENLHTLLLVKLLKKKKDEDQGNKQVDALKSLEFSEKQLPSIKYFISKESLNPEIMNELERTEEEEERADRSKWFTKDT